MENFEVKENEGQMEEIISAGQLLKILNSTPKEVSTLCQKACLKPKKDGFGNIYFSKDDIDVLKKVKELYEHSKELQEEKKRAIEEAMKRMENKKDEAEIEENARFKAVSRENFLQRAKLKSTRFEEVSKQTSPTSMPAAISSIEALENNIVERISQVLSEKMDGFDEVIVELIRAKTENETLRQKLNELNKENFNLKNENSCFKSVGLGFYIKKNTDDFIM